MASHQPIQPHSTCLRPSMLLATNQTRCNPTKAVTNQSRPRGDPKSRAGVYFNNILLVQRAKKTDALTAFFVFLGSVCTKAACTYRTLMKLISGVTESVMFVVIGKSLRIPLFTVGSGSRLDTPLLMLELPLPVWQLSNNKTDGGNRGKTVTGKEVLQKVGHGDAYRMNKFSLEKQILYLKFFLCLINWFYMRFYNKISFTCGFYFTCLEGLLQHDFYLHIFRTWVINLRKLCNT